MKIILGDNQFFGINHADLKKGHISKSKFNDRNKIIKFSNDSLSLGLDGFMINSNDVGFNLILNNEFDKHKEIHYSVPYPHKYANMVNENGMLSLLKFIFNETSMLNNIKSGLNFLFDRNVKNLTTLCLELEIPKTLKKGNYIYLQNIITDLIFGLERYDLLLSFINNIVDKGYRPGIITLNPLLVDKFLKEHSSENWIKNLIVCFNINKSGFNVFPSKKEVELFINHEKKYKLMGMSIFSSGAANIEESISYIKGLKLDYVVFGTSKIENVQKNLNLLKT